MSRMQRFPLTVAEEAEFWIRWKRGECVPAIGRAHGGIPPPVRRRSARVLTAAERENISRGLAARSSCRVIAQRLGRAPSTTIGNARI